MDACTFDAGGRILDLTPAAAAALGTSRADLVGRHLAAGDGSPAAALEELRQEVQRSGNVLRCRLAGADGTGPHACVLEPVRPAGPADAGEAGGVVCTFEDDGDGGAVPFDLRSPLFAHAPLGLGVASRDGAWLEVNQALCHLTGLDRETLLTLTVRDVTAPEDHHSDFVYVRQLLAGALSGYQIEKRWCRADGEPVSVSLVVSLVTTEVGGPEKLLVQVRDITARKAAEARARLLADLVECSADAIWARDGFGEIVYWNGAASRLLGYEAAERVGRRSRDEMPDSCVAETARALALAASGRSVGPLDTVRRHKDGHDVDVSITVSPIFSPDGSLLGFASVARDLSARRHHEAEQRDAHDRLERRVAALEEANTELLRSNEELRALAGDRLTD